MTDVYKYTYHIQCSVSGSQSPKIVPGRNPCLQVYLPLLPQGVIRSPSCVAAFQPPKLHVLGLLTKEIPHMPFRLSSFSHLFRRTLVAPPLHYMSCFCTSPDPPLFLSCTFQGPTFCKTIWCTNSNQVFQKLRANLFCLAEMPRKEHTVGHSLQIRHIEDTLGFFNKFCNCMWDFILLLLSRVQDVHQKSTIIIE